MKIINREPRGGKTTYLVDLMAQPGNEDVVLVAPSVRQAEAAYDTFVNRYGGEFNPDPGLRNRFISVQQLPPLTRAGTPHRDTFSMSWRALSDSWRVEKCSQ